MFRTSLVLLAIASSPASAQQLLNQSCTFTLTACDLQRDGSTACPAGATAEVRFRTEGESFDLVTRGVARGLEGTEDRERSFNLGSSGDSEVMRVYYIVGETGLDGAFWFRPETGEAGLDITGTGEGSFYEEYFSGRCTPQFTN